MGYGVYILSHSLSGVENFIVFVLSVLKDKVPVDDISFHVLHVGSQVYSIDMQSLHERLVAELSLDFLPSVAEICVADNVESVVKVCYDTLESSKEQRTVFIDMFSSPVVMSCVYNKLSSCTDKSIIRRLIFYTYKKYLTGDGEQHVFEDDVNSSRDWLAQRLLSVLGLAG